MKRSKFTEAQIAFALRQSETGTRVEEKIRRSGRSRVAQITAAGRGECPAQKACR